MVSVMLSHKDEFVYMYMYICISGHYTSGYASHKYVLRLITYTFFYIQFGILYPNVYMCITFQ